MTGWHRTATRFPAAAEPNVYRRQNGGVGAFGLIQLRGLLRAATDECGLYLAFPKFLRFGHAPFQVPWAELHVVSEKTLLGVHILQLKAGDPQIARIYLRGGISQAVANSLATALSKPSATTNRGKSEG